MPNESEPLDNSITAALLRCSEEFESAVLKGQAFFIAVAAQALVQNLRRFLPKQFAHFSAQTAESEKSSPLQLPEALYPNPDPAYSERVRVAVQQFRDSLLRGNLTVALEAVFSTEIITPPNPQRELELLELEAARTPGARRLLLLPRMAKLSLWLGDPEKAEAYASEILRLTGARGGRLEREGAIHDGHMVLGLLALRRGDKARAGAHLLDSARIDSSPEMKMIGPNLTLANELLRAGERQAVSEYLDMCRTFWPGGRKALGQWIAQIRAGQDPMFDPLYFSS